MPPPPAEKSIPLPILYEKYRDYLTESNLIKVRGLLIQQTDNKYLLTERDIYLENPEIKIRVSRGLGAGRPHVPASPHAQAHPGFIQVRHCEAKRIWDL